MEAFTGEFKMLLSITLSSNVSFFNFFLRSKISRAKAVHLLLLPRVRNAKPLVCLIMTVKGNAWFRVVLVSVGQQHRVVVSHNFKARRILVGSPALLLISSVVHFSSLVK